jgi:hypothetical protein
MCHGCVGRLQGWLWHCWQVGGTVVNRAGDCTRQGTKSALSAPAGSSLHSAVCVWVCSLCDCIKCVYWCVVSAIVHGVYVSCVHVWCASGPSRLQACTLIEPGSQLSVQLLACAALCELLHQLLCLSFADALTYLMHNRYCSTQSWAVEGTAVVCALEKEASGVHLV